MCQAEVSFSSSIHVGVAGYKTKVCWFYAFSCCSDFSASFQVALLVSIKGWSVLAAESKFSNARTLGPTENVGPGVGELEVNTNESRIAPRKVGLARPKVH